MFLKYTMKAAKPGQNHNTAYYKFIPNIPIKI